MIKTTLTDNNEADGGDEKINAVVTSGQWPCDDDSILSADAVGAKGEKESVCGN